MIINNIFSFNPRSMNIEILQNKLLGEPTPEQTCHGDLKSTLKYLIYCDLIMIDTYWKLQPLIFKRDIRRNES